MIYLNALAILFWQADATASATDVHWIMIFVGIMAACVLLVVIGLVVALVVVMKLVKRVEEKADSVIARAMPIVDKTKQVVEDLTPKIRSISENATQMSYTVRTKVEEYGVTAGEWNQTIKEWNRTAQDANLKARAHVAHVDRMMDSTLTQTEHLKQAVVHGVTVPVRQAAGVVAGLKAGIEKLVENFTPKKRGTASSAYRESTFTTGSGVRPIRERDDVAM